ncbi:MAG TPA: hypothetical protein VHS99_05130 [Chloroflexota bacterium]|nr:hypothetical protein [Chloroflexota bacterium]
MTYATTDRAYRTAGGRGYRMPARESRLQSTVAVGRPLGRTRSGAATWLAVSFALLVCWSLSYVLRQAVPYPLEPGSIVGNFALEGILLSLTWLGGMITLCLAMLSGAVAVRVTGSE